MRRSAFHILRIGLAITFLWIGLLILKSPESWAAYIQPWALDLLPLPARDVMVATAVFDIVIGFFLLIDAWIWIAAALASIHLLMVMVAGGITEVTVRDIGLLGGTLALFVSSYPANLWPLKTKPASSASSRMRTN